MGSVWKRLNRINKRASKFHFTASYSELWLEAGPNWQPTALSVVWTRKSRRVISDPVKWEPTMKSPYQGMCVWPVPENKEITVTMFRDPNKEEYENKDWFFMLEDVTITGKRKPVAQGRLNMKEFSTAVPTQHNLTVKLRPISKKVTSAKLTLTLTAELIREGKATDDDMRSIASLVSNSTMSDYERMKDAEEDPAEDTTVDTEAVKEEISSISKQMEELNTTAWDRSLELVPYQDAQPPLGSMVPQPTAQHPHRASTDSTEKKSVKDENENKTARHVEVDNSLPGLGDSIPRAVDLNLKTETKARGFGSREFKSTYNGPIGSYKSKVVSPLNIVRNGGDSDDTCLLIETKKSKSSKTVHIVSTSSLVKPSPEIKADGNHVPCKEPDKIVSPSSVENNLSSPEQKPDRIYVAPKEPDNMNLSIHTEENTVSPKAKKVSEEPVDLTENIEVIMEICEPEVIGSDLQIIEDDVSRNEVESDKKQNVSYQRTKSQEFRDYQQEFVLTSTIDLGPLSSPAILRKNLPEINKTPRVDTAKKVPETPSKSPPLYSVDNVHSLSGNVSPDKPMVINRNSASPSSDKADSGPLKTEITPSQSFLNNLNRNTDLDNSSSSENSTPVAEKCKSEPPLIIPKEVPRERTLIRQNTGGASTDLLEWAKSTCSTYSNVKVTNFTSSWRNGIAFCALIHHFYPDLISYDALTAHDIKYNCKLAFEAGEKLGIPRVMEPESMVIKRIPDKLAVITYLHQLRSCLGTEETRLLYEKSKEEQQIPNTGVRKSFSDGNIRLFSRSSSNDTDRSGNDLPTIEESPNIDIKPEKISEYRARAKTLVQQARSEEEEQDVDRSTGDGTQPKVILRQKSPNPKARKDNRLSYIDNEIKVLDAEQIEIDKQAAILDKRLRETSEDDQLMYDGLLQQWFTLVNKKNDLLRRQMHLNILEKEDDLEKKLSMLQEELRTLSEMEEGRKTEEDVRRENLLLEELVLVVNQRNQLVIQRDEEERMIEQDEALDMEVTKPENEKLRNNKKEDCRMQ